MGLNKQLNAIKGEQFPWMFEVTKCAPQHALQNLDSAFQRFFKAIAQAKRDKKEGKPKNPAEKRARYPKLKKKGKARDSFYIDNIQAQVKGKRIKIPKLGWVRMREELRFSGKLLSATVSRVADKWFVSIAVEVPDVPCTSHGTVGIDLGVNSFVALSDGTKIQAPKPLKRGLRRLRRLNRKVHKRELGSRNREKARTKLARCYYRISCIRKDFLDKLSTKIAENYRVVGLEDLNVVGMMKSKLARSISDLGWGEFRRQLAYKVGELVCVDRFFPSSKLCFECGYKLEEIPLDIREWTCPQCNHTHDRDVNAAKNIRREAVRLRTVGLTGIACGDGSSGTTPCRSSTKLPLMKQELGLEESNKPGKFSIVKKGKCSLGP
jgi:putative transposase